MKILVTGASGFLGSHVADALSDAAHDVTLLDIKQSQYLRKDQKMIIADIIDDKRIDEVVSDNDVIYHFAGIADIDACTSNPLDAVKYNILGTVILLEACRKASIKRFVFASSAYVFSNSGYFYKSSKQACESFIENYNELYGLPFTCLRYGSLYGDRADERNSIYNILKQALVEGKIRYSGSGDEIREFIHVSDASTSSVKILNPEFENQYIILTGTEKYTYAQLLSMIQEIMDNKIEIEIVPKERKAHYTITPYNFSPKLGKKLVNNLHIDIGQGLLHCMAEIYQSLNSDKYDKMGLFVNDK